MHQTTVKHTGSGTITVVFTNAPRAVLQPGDDLVVWVGENGKLHSPVGLGNARPRAG